MMRKFAIKVETFGGRSRVTIDRGVGRPKVTILSASLACRIVPTLCSRHGMGPGLTGLAMNGMYITAPYA